VYAPCYTPCFTDCPKHTCNVNLIIYHSVISLKVRIVLEYEDCVGTRFQLLKYLISNDNYDLTPLYDDRDKRFDKRPQV